MIENYRGDSGCLALFNLICFRTGTEETPFGERGDFRKSDKNRTFPPFPYGFLLRLHFPSPFSPLVRFFTDTK